jgi:hypothetical protein
MPPPPVPSEPELAEPSAADIGSKKADPDDEAEEDEVPEVISRWAAERGGQARIVPG